MNQENNYSHTGESDFSEAKHPERKRNQDNQEERKREREKKARTVLM